MKTSQVNVCVELMMLAINRKGQRDDRNIIMTPAQTATLVSLVIYGAFMFITLKPGQVCTNGDVLAGD